MEVEGHNMKFIFLTLILIGCALPPSSDFPADPESQLWADTVCSSHGGVQSILRPRCVTGQRCINGQTEVICNDGFTLKRGFRN